MTQLSVTVVSDWMRLSVALAQAPGVTLRRTRAGRLKIWQQWQHLLLAGSTTLCGVDLGVDILVPHPDIWTPAEEGPRALAISLSSTTLLNLLVVVPCFAGCLK